MRVHETIEGLRTGDGPSRALAFNPMKPRRRSGRTRPSSPSPTRAAWITARARNALRRPVFVGTVSILTFATSLVALVVAPQQARRAASTLRPAPAARPDTEPTASALAEAERQVARADSAIATARTELTQLVAATAAAASADTTVSGDTLSTAMRARRDSLASEASLLGRLLTRTENAPLLGSYRALAESSPMRGDARVRQLLDSLVEIERERESFNAVGGVDPVFVALTARANELGHSIEALADTRRAAIRRELAALAPPSPVVSAVASRPLPDTLARIKSRDTARAVATEIAARLARERAELTRLDSLDERARELANVGASPQAMLAAALVFGAMLGFGAALLDEVRRPRVASAHELERAVGQRVVGVVRRQAPSPERGRRAADREGPPYIDPGADGHQLIYLTVAAASANVLVLTVTGDAPVVAAVVAINFAAIASQEARNTLLVDMDGRASPVSAVLRLHSSPGLSGLLDGRVSWPEAVRTTRIGRDRTIDVVPTGDGVPPFSDLAALWRRDASRLGRRYDAIVLVSTVEQTAMGLPALLPIPDVIYCARVGQTPIANVKHAVEEIQQAGGAMRGIVLWDAPHPAVVHARPAARSVREPVTA